MTIKELRPRWFVETKEIEDPKCTHADQYESARFEKFMRERFRGARDEATKEVLAGMRTGRNLGDAIQDVIQALPAAKTRRLRQWVEQATANHIFAYVDFRKPGWVESGLMLTAAGPNDEVLETEEMESSSLHDDFAYYQSFSDVIGEMEDVFNRLHVPASLRGKGASMYLMKEMEQESKRAEKTRADNLAHALSELFESYPFVLVNKKDDYERALEAMGLATKQGKWKGAGIYDFRESPPDYNGTLDEYERSEMQYEAISILSETPQSEFKKACEILVSK